MSVLNGKYTNFEMIRMTVKGFFQKASELNLNPVGQRKDTQNGHIGGVTESKAQGIIDAMMRGLDICEAIHAEVNAFLQLRSDDELTAYVTIMPCFPCAKMMANSNIKRLVAAEEYVHNQSIEMLQKAGILINIVK